MDSNTKVYENLARRLATRHGFTLVKTRRRDPLALDYGLYRLEHAGTVLLRAKTLDEVHRFLLQASAVSAGVDRGVEICRNVLVAASNAGWHALPPDGGSAISVADAVPLWLRNYHAAA